MMSVPRTLDELLLDLRDFRRFAKSSAKNERSELFRNEAKGRSDAYKNAMDMVDDMITRRDEETGGQTKTEAMWQNVVDWMKPGEVCAVITPKGTLRVEWKPETEPRPRWTFSCGSGFWPDPKPPLAEEHTTPIEEWNGVHAAVVGRSITNDYQLSVGRCTGMFSWLHTRDCDTRPSAACKERFTNGCDALAGLRNTYPSSRVILRPRPEVIRPPKPTPAPAIFGEDNWDQVRVSTVFPDGRIVDFELSPMPDAPGERWWTHPGNPYRYCVNPKGFTTDQHLERLQRYVMGNADLHCWPRPEIVRPPKPEPSVFGEENWDGHNVSWVRADGEIVNLKLARKTAGLLIWECDGERIKPNSGFLETETALRYLKSSIHKFSSFPGDLHCWPKRGIVQPTIDPELGRKEWDGKHVSLVTTDGYHDIGLAWDYRICKDGNIFYVETASDVHGSCGGISRNAKPIESVTRWQLVAGLAPEYTENIMINSLRRRWSSNWRLVFHRGARKEGAE